MWIEETKIRTMHISHPEVNFIVDVFISYFIVLFFKQRNLYNKIFGGYLMRKSFELAWTTASLFA
jgi:acyl-coenzyme A thioesterase 9